jgi:hypothetical protein
MMIFDEDFFCWQSLSDLQVKFQIIVMTCIVLRVIVLGRNHHLISYLQFIQQQDFRFLLSTEKRSKTHISFTGQQL